MGNFIGNIGAAFIVAAAVIVIAKFLLEIGIIKDERSLKKYGSISLMTILVGGAYLAVITFMYNAMKERANLFEFEKIFAFFDMQDVRRACETPALSDMFSGMNMPLYPLIINLTGKLIFKKYILVAGFFSFMPACVSACMLYSMLSKRMNRENTENTMLILASLPLAFMLFAPTYISITVMLMVCSAYALSKGSKKGFIILSVLACLMSKFGIISFLILPLKKYIPRIINIFENGILTNKIALRILISFLMIFNGIVIFCLIRGI